jgi:hypothetical protein
MSEKKKKEIIDNLNRSIEQGGNSQSIEKLREILKTVEDDTYVSQFKKRAKRKPKKKK